MAHTYPNLIVHIIFSTKDRLPLIESEIKSELLPVIGGITQNFKGKTYAVNGMADHLHALVSIPPTIAVADVVNKLKANSSRWVHEKWTTHKKFGWQNGYGAFSVSKSNVPEVIKYIDTQEEHHRTMTFQEEYLAFLQKHGVDYDERYLWD